MILYFADRKFNILGTASTELPKGLAVIDDTKAEDVESGVSVFECKVLFDNDTRAKVEECTETGNFILRKHEDENELYTIIDAEIDTKKQTVYIYAEDAGLDLLNEMVSEYEADQEYGIEHYFTKFAYDSGFAIGINEASELKRKLTFDNEQTVTARLASVAAAFDNCEIAFSFGIEGLRCISKTINIYKKRGQDIGVTLRLNKEIDNIIIKKTIANLATALRATGATPDDADEPITLRGYEYDDGDFYVDGDALKSREALKRWSRYINPDEPNQQEGHEGYIVRLFSYDTVDQDRLFAETLKELKTLCDKEVNYEADILSLPRNVKIGDRINIVDEAGELFLSTRLLQLERSVVDDEHKAVLGEHLLKGSGISAKVQELAEEYKKSHNRFEKISNDAVKVSLDARQKAEAAGEEAKLASGIAEEAEKQAGLAVEKANEAGGQAELAVEKADNAKSTADTAKSTAETAKTTADTAKSTADTAKTTAEEAKSNFSALDSRVTAAETDISKNAEAITLRATKTEVAKTLEGYYTAKETEALIQTESDSITTKVSATYATKEEAVCNTEVSGQYSQVVTVENAIANCIDNVKIYGKTTQDGTPAPTAPVDMVSTGSGGSIALAVAGVNLLDLDSCRFYNCTHSNGVLTSNISGQYYAGAIITTLSALLMASKGKTFTFSIKSEIANRMLSIVIFGQRTSGQIYQEVNSYGRSVSITVAEDFESIGNVELRWNRNASAAFSDTTTTCTELQFEIGATPTEYTPYKGQSVSVATPSGFPGIPVTSAHNDILYAVNYIDANGQRWICDEIDLARGVYIQRIFKIVLDGTETWVQDSSNANRFRLGAINYSPLYDFGFDTTYNEAFYLCSHFKPQGYYHATDGGVISGQGGLGRWLSFWHSGCSTLDSWKAYLAAQYAAGTPVTVLARKLEAVEIPLEDAPTIPGNPAGNITVTSDGDIFVELSEVASGTTAKNAQEAAEGAQETANNAENAAAIAMSQFQQLANMISTLVTDGNGASLMTQTADGGWTFSMAAIQEALESGAINLEGLAEAIAAANGDIDALAESLGIVADYVKITTWNEQPCIELGETDNDFKLRITNTEIQFVDGTVVPAYISNKKLMIGQAQVKDELQFGPVGGRNLLLNSGVEHSNNNYGLATYTPSSPLVVGERYTLSMCVTPAAGVANFVAFVSNGYMGWGGDYVVSGTKKQILKATFTAHYASGKTPDDDITNAKVTIYRRPNDGTVTGDSTIHWIKIEKGNKATDWTPAPEDGNEAFGTWVWKRRENGNFGLSWKGADE